MAEDANYIKTIDVPIAKAGTTKEPAYITIDVEELMSEDFPADVLKEILLQGCKTLLNRGMSKITGAKTDKSKAAAMEIANGNLAKMRAGEIRITGGKSKGISGEVKTEAMRLARALVKDALKRAGKKVSHISAKEISAAAKALLEQPKGKELIKQAQAMVQARKEQEEDLGIDVSAIAEDPKLVAEAEAKAAKAREETAAKKAQGPRQRQRGEAHANA